MYRTCFTSTKSN